MYLNTTLFFHFLSWRLLKKIRRFVVTEFVKTCDKLVIRFFPFALWLPAIWRRKFPHHRQIFWRSNFCEKCKKNREITKGHAARLKRSRNLKRFFSWNSIALKATKILAPPLLLAPLCIGLVFECLFLKVEVRLSKYLNHRPGPEKVKTYRKIYNGLTLVSMGVAWTVFGYVLSR